MTAADAAKPALPVQRLRFWLLGLAFVQRIAYRFESTALPFGEAPLYDSAVYLRQADAIRRGDFGDATLVAFSPLYGWFLAVFGDGWMEAQLALGLATAFMIERIAARHSPAAGAIALALYIGYALPLFYETKLLSETLGLFLIVATVSLFLAADTRAARMVACGALLGLAVLARASLLFAAPLFVLAAFLPRAPIEPRRVGATRAASLALGLALVLGANGAWNLAHVGRFVPVTLVARTASIASSSGEWTGTLAVFSASGTPSAWDVVRQAEIELGRRPRPPEEAPSAARGIDLIGWLASSPSKLARTLSDVETAFQYGFYGERTEMRSLAWQPVSMGTLLLLGALGAFLLARSRGPGSALVHLPLFVAVLIVTTLFHPSSRYRLPMIVPLVLLGAMGLVELARVERPKLRRAATSIVAVAIALLALRHLMHPLGDPALWEVRVAEGEFARGDLDASRARIAAAYAVSEEGSDARERIDLLRRHRALPPPPP